MSYEYELFGKRYSGVPAILMSPVALVVFVLGLFLVIPVAIFFAIAERISPKILHEDTLTDFLTTFSKNDMSQDFYDDMESFFSYRTSAQSPKIALVLEKVGSFFDSETFHQHAHLSEEHVSEIDKILEPLLEERAKQLKADLAYIRENREKIRVIKDGQNSLKIQIDSYGVGDTFDDYLVEVLDIVSDTLEHLGPGERAMIFGFENLSDSTRNKLETLLNDLGIALDGSEP